MAAALPDRGGAGREAARARERRSGREGRQRASRTTSASLCRPWARRAAPNVLRHTWRMKRTHRLLAAVSLIACVATWFLLNSQSTERGVYVQSQSRPRASDPIELMPGTTSSPIVAASQGRTNAPRWEPLPGTGKFRLRCGSATCLVDREACCETESGTTCVPRNQECPRYSGRRECDETGDCSTGMKCCEGHGKAVCVAGDCEPWQAQLCTDGAECPSGECWMGTRCRGAVPGRLKLPTSPKPPAPQVR